MARSTCNPNVEVPKGMRKFQVIRSTIKDSLGQYCEPGDMAVLTKEVAQGYLDKNFIKVALPDDFNGDYDSDNDEGDTSDSDGEGETERGEAEDNPSAGGGKGGSGTIADSEGGRPSRRTRKAKASKAS